MLWVSGGIGGFWFVYLAVYLAWREPFTKTVCLTKLFLDVLGILWPRRGTLAKVCRLTSGFAIKACFVVSLPRLRTRPGRYRQFIQNQLFAFLAVLQRAIGALEVRMRRRQLLQITR